MNVVVEQILKHRVVAPAVLCPPEDSTVVLGDGVVVPAPLKMDCIRILRIGFSVDALYDPSQVFHNIMMLCSAVSLPNAVSVDKHVIPMSQELCVDDKNTVVLWLKQLVREKVVSCNRGSSNSFHRNTMDS